MSITLLFYIARRYAFYLFWVFMVTSGIVMLFEVLEMTKMISNRPISFVTILQMALLKNFMHVQRTFAFIVLLAAILLYANLNRNSELIIMRSSGMSIFQLSFPAIMVAFLFGIFYITAFNPVASVFVARYEKLATQHLKDSQSQLAILKTGLWIKQAEHGGQKNIMHALRLSQENSELYDVTVYFLDEKNRFLKRIDSPYAKLHNAKWELKDAIETAAGHYLHKHDNFELSTNITFNQIQESMIRPETLSFWKLPAFISVAEESGFSVLKHKLYFYRLLISPLFFSVMTLLGIAFTLTNPRSGFAGRLGAIGLLIGFFIYFAGDIIFALGASSSIPLWLAVLAPTLITFAIGVYLHLHHEDA